MHTECSGTGHKHGGDIYPEGHTHGGTRPLDYIRTECAQRGHIQGGDIHTEGSYTQSDIKRKETHGETFIHTKR